MSLELRISGPSGHRCNVVVSAEATLADVHAAIEAETGILSADQGLFFGLDELLFDCDVAALGSAEVVDVLLVQSPGHRVKSLLNQLGADSAPTIAARLAQVKVQNVQELNSVARRIHEKALTQPHCCEACVDLVSALRVSWPEFPAEEHGGRPQSLQRSLVYNAQDEFEKGPFVHGGSVKMDEETLRMVNEKHDRALANMKFIGTLFLKKFLAIKVVGKIFTELIGAHILQPSAVQVECVLALLSVAGPELDSLEQGNKLMLQIFARITELRRLTTLDGRASFSDEMQCQIQNLLHLRQRGWRAQFVAVGAAQCSANDR